MVSKHGEMKLSDNWEQDKRWSDRFLTEIKSILGVHLIGEPAMEEDAEHNTDLMVLKLDAVRIGCRVRKHKYISQYGNEFTIRAGRPSGVKTELTKIIEGWGDYFFYGFCDEQEKALERWLLGDLKAFRIWFNRKCLSDKTCPGIHKSNSDGSSNFLSFQVQEIPDFIISSSWIERVQVRAAS